DPSSRLRPLPATTDDAPALRPSGARAAPPHALRAPSLRPGGAPGARRIPDPPTGPVPTPHGPAPPPKGGRGDARSPPTPPALRCSPRPPGCCDAGGAPPGRARTTSRTAPAGRRRTPPATPRTGDASTAPRSAAPALPEDTRSDSRRSRRSDVRWRGGSSGGVCPGSATTRRDSDGRRDRLGRGLRWGRRGDTPHRY